MEACNVLRCVLDHAVVLPISYLGMTSCLMAVSALPGFISSNEPVDVAWLVLRTAALKVTK